MASGIWSKWLSRLTKVFPVSNGNRSRADKARLHVEVLEDRIIPSVSPGFNLSITSNSANAAAVAADSQGNILVAGTFSSSATFNTTSGSPVTLTSQGSQDAFVAKYTAAGTLLWADDLGGSTTNNGDTPSSVAFAVAVDSSGNAYVTGYTYCDNFPLTGGAYQTTFRGNADAFLAKLSPTGSLLYATLLGGAGISTGGNNVGNAIAVDNSGDAYIAGYTYSASFPTTANAYQTATHGARQAFLSEFDTNLGGASSLVYSSYLGGSGGDEIAFGVALHSGNVYVAGRTNSSNFPLVNPFQASYGGSSDGFVSEFDTSLSGAASLLYSTYLGGSGSGDGANAIAVDGSGNIYVTGQTNSTNFPTSNALLASNQGSFDAFLTELNPTGQALVYSTYLGGSGLDVGTSLAVDASGTAYVTGYTNSPNFPTSQPLQSSLVGSQDAFVAVVQPGGSTLSFSTYLGGGSGPALGNGIALDGAGNAYVVGSSSSNGFITQLMNFTQTQASQTINFAAPNSPISFAQNVILILNATGGASGNPVTFTIDASSTGTGTINGNMLTVTGAGSIVIDANQAGNSNYSAALQVQQTLVVNPAGQSISFIAPISPISFAPNENLNLGAAGGTSGNPVTFTIDASSTGAGTINGNLLTITGAGSIVIDANQAGNSNYNAAAQVQQTLVVNPAGQTISFTAPSSPIAFVPNATVNLDAAGGGSGNPVTFTIDGSSTGSGSINGNVLTVTGAGSIVIDANQAGNSNYNAAAQVQQTLVVNPASQTLMVTVNSDILLLGHTPPPLTGTANGVSFTGSTTFKTTQGDTLKVTLSSSVTAKSPVGVYAITATITGTGSDNYAAPVPGTMYVVTIGRDAGTGAKGVSFWDNQGNAKRISSSDLTSLDALNLRNDNGSVFDPTTAVQLDKWLHSDTDSAVKALSVQLATMDLNVMAGYVSSTDLVYAGGLRRFDGTGFSVTGLDGGGFITVGNLMTLATNALAQSRLPGKGDDHDDRLGRYVDALEDALEAANNDQSFVQQAVPAGT